MLLGWPKSIYYFTAKCLNNFDAHCSSKFIITSVVLDIRDRSLYLWPGGAERVFWGDHWNFSSSLYAVFAGKKLKPQRSLRFFSLKIVLGTYINLYSFESSMK